MNDFATTGITNKDGKHVFNSHMPITFRVCTLNAGNFAYGADGTAIGDDAMYNKFLDTFRQCNADVYMFCEWDKNWNENELSSDVFSFLKPYHSSYYGEENERWYCQMIYSPVPIKLEYYQHYSVTDRCYFIDDVLNIHGVDVHFISTHIFPGVEETAKQQMREVMEYASNKEYYVVAGDMNIGTHENELQDETTEKKRRIALEEIAILESHDGQSAQGSGWGLRGQDNLFCTAGRFGYAFPDNLVKHYLPYDNIVISNNLRFKNLLVIPSYATDHDAVVADIEILI